MLWVGLATAGSSVPKERLKAEFGVAHAHDAFDGALAQFADRRENLLGHNPELPVLLLHPVQFARLIGRRSFGPPAADLLGVDVAWFKSG
jgi:hypothetical protein